MQILYDASSLNYRLDGIGYYFFNLYQAMKKYYPQNDYHMLLLNQKFKANDVEFLCMNENVLYYEQIRKKIFTRLGNPGLILRKTDGLINRLLDRYRNFGKNEIFHGQELLYDRFPKLINTMTIHDLTAELFPEYHTEANIRRNKKRMKFAEQHCPLIATVSQSTCNDIWEKYPKLVDRVEVLYESCHPIYDLPVKHNNRNFLKQYQIEPDKPYLLAVGTIEPRKNLTTVLKIFRSLKKQKSYQDLQLVLVGGKGWKSEAFFRFLERHKNLEDIFLTGYVPLKEMPLFYKNAECFIYLSFYEGFGLPVLEAMKIGCPVVSSNLSSIPEIAADAALLVNPDEEEEARLAIEQILNDNVLREELIQRGLKRGKYFTWQRVAQKHYTFYKKLLQIAGK